MEIWEARSSRLLPKILPVAWVSSMWGKMHDLAANLECLMPRQRSMWALWIWLLCQPRKIPSFVSFCAVSWFDGCLRWLLVLSRAASWNFRAFVLFGLELGSRYLWSYFPYLQGMCEMSFSPAGTEQRDVAPALTAPGAAWTVAVRRQAGFAILLKLCLVLPGLLCFPFLILFLLSWTPKSLQRTTWRNRSAHRCLMHSLPCLFALWRSRV